MNPKNRKARLLSARRVATVLACGTGLAVSVAVLAEHGGAQARGAAAIVVSGSPQQPAPTGADQPSCPVGRGGGMLVLSGPAGDGSAPSVPAGSYTVGAGVQSLVPCHIGALPGPVSVSASAGTPGASAPSSSPASAAASSSPASAATSSSPASAATSSSGAPAVPVAAGAVSAAPVRATPGPAPISFTVATTNDAAGSGYDRIEMAKASDADVTFQTEVTNTSATPVVVTQVTDSWPGQAAFSPSCAAPMVGTTLAPGASAVCRFTLDGYSPARGTSRTNTVEVTAHEVGAPGVAATIESTSEVITEAATGPGSSPSSPASSPAPSSASAASSAASSSSPGERPDRPNTDRAVRA